MNPNLSRLRSYEEICRQSASAEATDETRAELSKFADTCRDVAKDIEAIEAAETEAGIFS